MNLSFISFFAGVDNSTNDPGQYVFGGKNSWLYYLFGAIFLVLALVSLWYTWKVRHSKQEYANIAQSYGWFKKFWYLNRYPIMIMVTVVLVVIAISFFMLNSKLISTK